ncbi:YozQ family protein [Bacillus piscicola]|uniref:YozQ family protein n=1 Tax=Bacillus piscicola TaxID=1632684 RepID=UPI001F092B51|nr:YozQ family protein [Bacillus piscicola]
MATDKGENQKRLNRQGTTITHEQATDAFMEGTVDEKVADQQEPDGYMTHDGKRLLRKNEER